jgi:hypothetical protein
MLGKFLATLACLCPLHLLERRSRLVPRVSFMVGVLPARAFALVVLAQMIMLVSTLLVPHSGSHERQDTGSSAQCSCKMYTRCLISATTRLASQILPNLLSTRSSPLHSFRAITLIYNSLYCLLSLTEGIRTFRSRDFYANEGLPLPACLTLSGLRLSQGVTSHLW